MTLDGSSTPSPRFSVIAAGFDGGITMLGSFVMLQGKSAAKGRELDLKHCFELAVLDLFCLLLPHRPVGSAMRGPCVGRRRPATANMLEQNSRPIEQEVAGTAGRLIDFFHDFGCSGRSHKEEHMAHPSRSCAKAG